jgi:hypothetical protein
MVNIAPIVPVVHPAISIVRGVSPVGIMPVRIVAGICRSAPAAPWINPRRIVAVSISGIESTVPGGGETGAGCDRRIVVIVVELPPGVLEVLRGGGVFVGELSFVNRIFRQVFLHSAELRVAAGGKEPENNSASQGNESADVRIHECSPDL